MFTLLVDTVFVFAVATPGIGLLAHRLHQPRLVGAHATLGFLAALFILQPLYHDVLAHGILVVAAGFPLLAAIEVCLEVDALSVFMAAVYVLLGLVTAIYSMTAMDDETGVSGYFALLLGITGSMIGVVMAGDLFTLFLFWEVMCLCSYALVAFHTEQWEPIEAGYKYLIMSSAGSLTTLFAMTLLYGLTGTLNLALLSDAFSGSVGGPWLSLAVTLFLAGFGLQAGMAPFHTWLPDAHSAAPAPVSAILSGAMVMTGVYGLLRVLPLLFTPVLGSWRLIVGVFAVLTMFTGNLMALFQDDVKRLLAFSTIANVGYILLGLATSSLLGFTGSLFQILNHAVVKALLFLCSGAFLRQAKTRRLSELAGIHRTMPVTCAAFIVGVIALIGIPPLNLFWSESTILMAGVDAGMLPLALAMAANLVLTAAYCLRLMQALLLHDAAPPSTAASEAPASLLVPIGVLAVLCITIGLYPSPFRAMAEEAARAALNLHAYVNALGR
jgi:proton-translocating NADH-quinone oxidoreductase chain M